MKSRIHALVCAKADGKKRVFASLLGWSPQYLAKLLKGESIGLQPILTLLKTFPDVSARWLLFGTGSMIDGNQSKEEKIL